jgi:hypothetical protein
VIALVSFAVPSLTVTCIGEIHEQTARVGPSLLIRVESANGALLCLNGLAHALEHTVRILRIHSVDFMADCRCCNDEWWLSGSRGRGRTRAC